MSSVVTEIGIGLVERFGGDVGKMLAAALGGGLGASGYRYLQPHFAGRGFDRSKTSARKTGTNIGRNIATGVRLDASQVRNEALRFNASYRRPKKYGRPRHNYCHNKCNCRSACNCK